jgi:GH15 family glucan-1,4-alpha-glucosidase
MEFRLASGSTIDLVLELQPASRALPGPPEAAQLWQQTRDGWKEAVPGCVDIPAQRDVRQSIAVLRGMTDPDGGTVAAATTALPERAEAGRNYDYRFAWVRDVAFIGHAGGAVPGAEVMLTDAVGWVGARLLEDGPKTHPAYCCDGRPVPEPEHLGLPGYPGGSDVVGNRASKQFQLDLFGEALLIFALAAEKDLLDADGWRAAEVALGAIDANADEPEAGIWEIEPPRLWTHSRLICAAGLKAIAEQAAPMRWRTRAIGLADHLLSQADATSLHASGHWQRAPDDPRVDASLLLSEVRGALPPNDPRSVATRAAILKDLCDDDFLYRFAEEGQPLGQEEGAFLVCNFWMALAYLGDGDARRGAQWFERTRASCGGSGLFSEEYDVAQRQLRGNLPQAFVHALLIETAGRLRDV